MARPWDTKLICQLTEGELHQYVGHLQDNQTVEAQGYIDRAVEHVLEQWAEERGKPATFGRRPYRFVLPTARARRPVSLATAAQLNYTAATPAVAAYQQVEVILPDWLPEDYAKYLAREQILEQVQPDYQSEWA